MDVAFAGRGRSARPRMTSACRLSRRLVCSGTSVAVVAGGLVLALEGRRGPCSMSDTRLFSCLSLSDGVCCHLARGLEEFGNRWSLGRTINFRAS